jgi:hypothetical protein
MKKVLALVAILLAGGTGALARAEAFTDVVINGQRLTQSQLELVEAQLGAYIPPGVYLLDASGCWLKLDTGEGGCLDSVNVYSRNGSGERTSDGSWNHWSDSAGMGVGGTGDGCIYTTSGWSNC